MNFSAVLLDGGGGGGGTGSGEVGTSHWIASDWEAKGAPDGMGAAGGSGGNFTVTLVHMGLRSSRFQAEEKRMATGR